MMKSCAVRIVGLVYAFLGYANAGHHTQGSTSAGSRPSLDDFNKLVARMDALQLTVESLRQTLTASIQNVDTRSRATQALCQQLLIQTNKKPVGCPQGYVTINTSCYKVVAQDSHTWSEAVTRCNLDGAHLVTMETPAEIQAVKKMVADFSYPCTVDFWIGASDTAREGWFVWQATGHRVTYTDWHQITNQPDNGASNEHCVEMYCAFGYDWNDLPCDSRNGYICEIELK